MAWSVTDRDGGESNASSADIVSSSFTPAAECILLMVNANLDNDAINSITGHGTWVQIFLQIDGAGSTSRDIELWACFTGSSPSAGTVTIDRNYMWRHQWALIEIDETTNGFDIASGIAAAFGTESGEAGYDNRAYDSTPAAFADATNLTFGIYAGTGADSLVSIDANFTALTSFGTTNGFLEPHYDDAEDNSITANCNNYTSNGFWALEVKQAVAGGGDTILPMSHYNYHWIN